VRTSWIAIELTPPAPPMMRTAGAAPATGWRISIRSNRASQAVIDVSGSAAASATMAVLLALDKVNGDLSDGNKKRANQWQLSRVLHLGGYRSQRRILIPGVLIASPASTAADPEINARPVKSRDGLKDRHLER
jgi:hypothetical protein